MTTTTDHQHDDERTPMTDPTSDQLEHAEATKALAEAKAAESLAAKHEADARKAEAEAACTELTLQSARQAWAELMADDDHHHVYRFNETVSAASVEKCISRLSQWERLADGELLDVELVLKSPGGSVIDGMALWDHIKSMQASGHRFTTICRGMAASMAGILLQAGDVRVMGAESYLLIHEVSFGIGGKIGEVEDELAFVKKIQDRILTLFAERTTLTKAQLARRWKRKDWWIDSTEAIKLGFADVVR